MSQRKPKQVPVITEKARRYAAMLALFLIGLPVVLIFVAALGGAVK